MQIKSGSEEYGGQNDEVEQDDERETSPMSSASNVVHLRSLEDVPDMNLESRLLIKNLLLDAPLCPQEAKVMNTGVTEVAEALGIQTTTMMMVRSGH